MKLTNANRVTISKCTLPSLSIENSKNIEVIDSNIGVSRKQSPRRIMPVQGKKQLYLPLNNGPRTGLDSRYAPGVCTNQSCQHAYLSDIEILRSTKITTMRNRVKDCPLCGSHGYTLDGVYNQIAEEFTAMLFGGITKEQLKSMERVVGLAIQSKDYESARSELVELHRNWKSLWGIMDEENKERALIFIMAFITMALTAYATLKPDAPDVRIDYTDNSVNYYLSGEFADKKTALLESTPPPTSEKPLSKE